MAIAFLGLAAMLRDQFLAIGGVEGSIFSSYLKSTGTDYMLLH